MSSPLLMRYKMSNSFRLRRHFASEYGALKNAINRCENPKHSHYANYGGRGITVADEFKGSEGFTNFFVHVGPKPTPDHTLDRMNNDEGYQPGNVRWVTRKENQSNRRPYRSGCQDLGWGVGTFETVTSLGHLRRKRSPLITYQGRTQTLCAWADELGLQRSTLRQRFAKGWSLERCMAPHLWAPSSAGPVLRYADRASSAQEITQDFIKLLDSSILDVRGRTH